MTPDLTLPKPPNPPPEFVDDFLRVEIEGRDLNLAYVVNALQEKAGRPILLEDIDVDISRGYESDEDTVEFTVCKVIGKKPNPNLDRDTKYYNDQMNVYNNAVETYNERNKAHHKAVLKKEAELEQKERSDAIRIMNKYKMSHKYLGD